MDIEAPTNKNETSTLAKAAPPSRMRRLLTGVGTQLVGVVLGFLLRGVSFNLAAAIVSLFVAAGMVLLLGFGIQQMIKVQKSLGELLATVVFGCIVMAFFQNGQTTTSIETIFATALAMMWAFAGSTWGWLRIVDFEISSPLRRFWFLFKGWMLFGGTGLLFVILILQSAPSFSHFFVGCAIAFHLLIPAALDEYTLHRRRTTY